MSLNLSKPAGIKLTILATDQLIAKMPKIEQLAENIMIIFGNTHETRRFIEAYPKVKEINYGGIIKKSRFKAIQQCHFLTDAEAEDARKMKDLGIVQYMQQVPTSKKEDLNTML